MKRFNCLFILYLFLSFCLRAQTFFIGPGIELTATGSPAIVLNNASLVNNGHFTSAGSTVLFTGAGPAYIGGSHPISFYKLAVNMSGGELQLAANATVNGSLVLDSGNLQLNSYTLRLGSTAYIAGERNEARIMAANGGVVTITVPLNAPHAVNPGNIGVEITSEADLGPTVITRGHTLENNVSGQGAIQRWFDIIPSLAARAPATLRFFYFDAELNGNHTNKLNLFAAPEGRQSWTAEGKDYSDEAGKWLLKGNIALLQRFTLAPALPGNASGAAVRVYPNPARNMFTLSLFSATEKRGVASLCDRWGRVLETRIIHCLPGINITEWNIGQYAAGAYHLVFEQLDVGNTTVLKQ